MCMFGGPKPQAATPTAPAQKAPTAPVLPGEDLRNPGNGRKKLRIDLTQPLSGAGVGLKIPM